MNEHLTAVLASGAKTDTNAEFKGIIDDIKPGFHSIYGLAFTAITPQFICIQRFTLYMAALDVCGGAFCLM